MMVGILLKQTDISNLFKRKLKVQSECFSKGIIAE